MTRFLLEVRRVNPCHSRCPCSIPTEIIHVSRTMRIAKMGVRSSRPSANHIVLIVALFGCGGLGGVARADSPKPPPTVTVYSLHHDHIIGTSLDVWLLTSTKADAEAAEQAILDDVERLRLVFSTFDPKSEISLLNHSTGRTPASAEMIEVLRDYETWQRRSGGAFNGQL